MNEFKFNTIEDAVEDIRTGKLIIVVDDEDRENEGDFITAAQLITPEKINFMEIYGRGVLCAPLTEERCDELDLPQMVRDNTSVHATPFTVTIDYLHGCTTGISAEDRAKTILALTQPNTKPEDFGRPGHISPLRARKRGVIRRAGHTEAAIDMMRLAGLFPAGVLIEIKKDDGSMARLPDLIILSERFGLKIITVHDLIAYMLKQDSLVEKGEEVNMPTQYGHFRLIPFLQKSNGMEHIALIKGKWTENEPILVRVH
ncbi:MAG: 3,4-dihydroxy-2-butanone-4-phosphate synthase, partial [Bacteroidales bacterium]|nr:3,4-dihydroxy-2-butanone-4-phosphate synthase [Bacteroidales bacterium]